MAAGLIVIPKCLNACNKGFRGRTRPNLFRQETTSIMCALRILYHLLADESRISEYEAVESRLLSLVNGGLEYFLSLSSEVHREAWTQILLLILVRTLQLQPGQVCIYIIIIVLCNIIIIYAV